MLNQGINDVRPVRNNFLPLLCFSTLGGPEQSARKVKIDLALGVKVVAVNMIRCTLKTEENTYGFMKERMFKSKNLDDWPILSIIENITESLTVNT